MSFYVQIYEYKHDRATLSHGDCPVTFGFSVVRVRVVWWQEHASGASQLSSTSCIWCKADCRVTGISWNGKHVESGAYMTTAVCRETGSRPIFWSRERQNCSFIGFWALFFHTYNGFLTNIHPCVEIQLYLAFFLSGLIQNSVVGIP